MTGGTSGQMPERDPFDDRLERQLVSAAQKLERERSARGRDGARARIAVGAATAVAALGSLVVALVLIGGDDSHAPLTSVRQAGGCAPYAQAGQLRIARLRPPPIVARAAPSLSPTVLASGWFGGGSDAEGTPRSAIGSVLFCPAPLGVGAVYDPRLYAKIGIGRRAGGTVLSALRGPERSGVAPSRSVDRSDRSWKICLSIAAGQRPSPAAIACAEPDRVIDSGLVARMPGRDGRPSLFAFYVVTEARLLQLRFADGHVDYTMLSDGSGTIERRTTDPARTPVSYRPVLGDGTPLDGGGPIDYEP